MKQAKKYLYVDEEKIKNPAENYNGKNLKKYNINSVDGSGRKLAHLLIANSSSFTRTSMFFHAFNLLFF